MNVFQYSMASKKAQGNTNPPQNIICQSTKKKKKKLVN